MSKNIERFEIYLQPFEAILQKAGKQKNPALFLYQNGARTPLFMLEALAKMDIELYKKKKFTKLKEQFKLLEDALGAIDYYDAIAKNLAGNKKIPAPVLQYLQAQTREKIQHLNELLTEKKWLGEGNVRLTKIRKKLAEVDWLNEEKEVAAIHDFYGKAIYQIIEFTHSTEYHFDNMEEDVHELRRKLRWLSIYPQALQGSIQLAADKGKEKHLDKYLTKEIIGSPFNKMPDSGEKIHFLLLEKNHFLALSWMIDALGKLKDNGLQVVALKEALQQTENLTEAAALKKAYPLLGAKQIKLSELLRNAATIAKAFFKEQNLEHLVIGTVGNK